MSLTKKTVVFLTIVAIGLAASKADSLPETGPWVRIIGTVTYGPDTAACYSTCKKGQFCSIRNKVAVCKPYCGDGIVVGAEALKTGCDDGNTQAGDGCSKCVPEPLWDCKSDSPGSQSICSLRCGNGILETLVGEQCDDQNRENLDGCSRDCKIVLSWECTSVTTSVTANPIVPSVCKPKCGDGIRVGAQLGNRGCDDGAKADGDGCSATCTVEPAWICSGTPSICKKSCGNGILNLAAGEVCDNAGTDTDGCKDDCTVDPDFTCTKQDGKRSICTTPCGDGKIKGTEECDDGNSNPGDGCNKDCKIGTGWKCTNTLANNPASVCQPKCGDGILVGAEVTDPRRCDDANTKTGDGCEDCHTLPLWSCVGAPSVCTNLCGNGRWNQDVMEACDNGHDPNNPDDGCTSLCVVDVKWTCANTPFAKSICTPKCGDGFRVGAEKDPDGCDDAGVTAGDGCSATCKVETGYTCTGAGAGTCTPNCGDGIRVGTQTADNGCDDGNTAANDGCSATCVAEAGYTCTGSGAGSCKLP